MADREPVAHAAPSEQGQVPHVPRSKVWQTARKGTSGNRRRLAANAPGRSDAQPAAQKRAGSDLASSNPSGKKARSCVTSSQPAEPAVAQSVVAPEEDVPATAAATDVGTAQHMATGTVAPAPEQQPSAQTTVPESPQENQPLLQPPSQPAAGAGITDEAAFQALPLWTRDAFLGVCKGGDCGLPDVCFAALGHSDWSNVTGLIKCCLHTACMLLSI